jgi:hypothetical protein
MGIICGRPECNEPCHYCGEPCDALAGNPGLWPLGFAHSEDPGVCKWHHARCVTQRLALADEQRVRIAKLESALRTCIARAGAPDPVEACRLVIGTAAEALGNQETSR